MKPGAPNAHPESLRDFLIQPCMLLLKKRLTAGSLTEPMAGECIGEAGEPWYTA